MQELSLFGCDIIIDTIKSGGKSYKVKQVVYATDVDNALDVVKQRLDTCPDLRNIVNKYTYIRDIKVIKLKHNTAIIEIIDENDNGLPVYDKDNCICSLKIRRRIYECEFAISEDNRFIFYIYYYDKMINPAYDLNSRKLLFCKVPSFCIAEDCEAYLSTCVHESKDHGFVEHDCNTTSCIYRLNNGYLCNPFYCDSEECKAMMNGKKVNSLIDESYWVKRYDDFKEVIYYNPEECLPKPKEEPVIEEEKVEKIKPEENNNKFSILNYIEDGFLEGFTFGSIIVMLIFVVIKSICG